MFCSCGETATLIMYSAWATSRDESARNGVAMCTECAAEAFESGEYESGDAIQSEPIDAA
jgi:hypothetical protein